MEPIPRRRFLRGAGLTVGGLLVGGPTTLIRAEPGPELGPAPDRPERQHAWNDFLRVNADGNPVMPRFHRLLMFDVDGDATPTAVRRLEAQLRDWERRYDWSSEGLMFVLGWGPKYFAERLGVDAPIPRPQALSSFETPKFDDYEACLHLASDDEVRLNRLEAELREGDFRVRETLRRRETRTGFVGEGLPAERQDVSGIPSGCPVSGDSPLYMGFSSGFRRNQATEDEVAIPDGPLAGGTTMQVSWLRLRLEGWYELLDPEERVDRMFAPSLTSDDVEALTSEAPTFTDQLAQTAREQGVIGHLQAAAQARRNGRPLILRRDFNTTDEGTAGLHFVSLQRSIDDFVQTRRAMNASNMIFENPSIKPRVNNGIKESIFVLRRANYLVPSRAQRAFPLLPNREDGIG